MKPNTQSDYHRRIARVVEAILADPGAAHSVESLAGVACLSPFHFHRIYRGMTGEGIAETVRRVRMAQAAHQLTRAGDDVTTVAFDVGYESPQAFARAFRDLTGVSPSHFQTRQRALKTQGGNGASAQIAVIDLPPLTVLALRHHGPIANIGQTYRKLYDLIDEPVRAEAMNHQIGIGAGDPAGGDDFIYLAGTALRDLGASFAGLERVAIAGGLYASYRLVGPYALIASAYSALFSNWLPGSGYEPDHRPTLEFYRTRSTRVEQAESITDLMIPIRKA
jgi:AraC family transcriptional regulator